MKKLKEFLMFLIPFAALSTLSVIWFAINTQGGGRYLKLMVADPFFIIALMHAFVPSIIMSLIVCFIYKLLLFLFKRKMTRKQNYIILFVLSLIPPVIYILIMTRTFDIVNNTVFTLQIGIIVTFIFWLAESVKEIIRKHFFNKPDYAREQNK